MNTYKLPSKKFNYELEPNNNNNNKNKQDYIK